MRKYQKLIKKIFTLFSVFCDFRIDYNPDKPDTEKIGMRVIEKLIQVDKVLKKYFHDILVFPDFLINYNQD